MPVKGFVLLVVYLLVPVSCNFAKKNHMAADCISRMTHSLNGDLP